MFFQLFIAFDMIFQEGIAVGRSLALATGDQVDGNKEMIAYGMMNIIGSFTSCYLTTGNLLFVSEPAQLH